MFLAHYGIGLGLKRANPVISLGILFITVQLVDIFWTIFVFLGIERVNIIPGYTAANHMQFVYYPFTHSLAATFIWGALAFATSYFLFRKSQARLLSASIIAISVMSHFFLDVIVHIPDLSVAGNGTPALGFAVWNDLALTLFFEISIFAIGLYIYYRTTKGRGFWSKIGPALLGMFLIVSQIMTTGGPPPPEGRAFVLVGFTTYIIIAAIAFWIDRNRDIRKSGEYSVKEKALNPRDSTQLGTRLK